jgi:hypothetical protein
MAKPKLLLVIFMLTVKFVAAQYSDLGSWNILNVKYNLTQDWSCFGEGQLRSLKFYDDFHYYEVKGGVSYKFNKNLTFTLGAGSYQTYKEGGNFVLPKNNNEIRIWPQLILVQPLNNFKIEHRYRIENRFTSNGYKNRFRYRLGVSYAFGKKTESVHPYILGFQNEIFFTDKEPYFERNRLSINLSHRFTKHTSVLVGYVHQFDYKINDETGRDFFQIGYYIELF